MKRLIIVAFIALAAAVYADYPKEKDEKFNKIIAECRTEFKMTDEEYTKFRMDKVDFYTEAMEGLIHCVMEKTGIIKNKQLQKDATVQVFTPIVGEEKAKSIVQACSAQDGYGNYGTAVNLHRCFLKNGAY